MLQRLIRLNKSKGGRIASSRKREKGNAHARTHIFLNLDFYKSAILNAIFAIFSYNKEKFDNDLKKEGRHIKNIRKYA